MAKTELCVKLETNVSKQQRTARARLKYHLALIYQDEKGQVQK